MFNDEILLIQYMILANERTTSLDVIRYLQTVLVQMLDFRGLNAKSVNITLIKHLFLLFSRAHDVDLQSNDMFERG